MEKLDRALEICAEIERLQTELKTILIELDNNDCAQCLTATSSDNPDEPVSPAAEILSQECNQLTEKECNANNFVEQKPIARANITQSCDLRKSFTLNDRFRFKRELFGGSDADFMNAIDTISAMSSVEEVKEYLSEMGWDMKSDIVEEFLNIINNYFNGAFGLNRN